MRLSVAPPCSATASTSLRCCEARAAAYTSTRAAFSSSSSSSSNLRRRRRRHDLHCSALFDGLFGNKSSAAASPPASPPPGTPTTKKAASSSQTKTPLPKLPRAPTAEDGSAPPPPYEEAVLLTRPCPSGDGSTVSLVFCSGGGNAEDGNVVPVDTRALEGLCEAVGWPKRPAEAVRAALEGSFVVASLVARKGASSGSAASEGDPPLLPPAPSSSDQLVGLARATSDRAFNATIWDVLVHPDWQGLGLGRALVERTTAALLAAGVGTVTLFAAADAVDFYEALGYEADPDGIRGMFYAGK